jgi:site-specific DNA-methyltransferase (adenine-specific)
MMNLYQGDCLEVLKTFPDNSIEAVVTDPPYGLSFMGKKWDYDVPSVEVWKEVLRVLKPGGHLLSFGGTRTYHRMVVNIEDAGFEIRDQIQWLYGSGFPKSHDVSKGIDKAAGAEREVLETKSMPDIRSSSVNGEYQPLAKGKPPMEFKVTAPSTDAAKQWEGWGTALKPANEPIVLARKPLEKGLTIAQNVQKWGTGGLNIDACRVGTEQTVTRRGITQEGPGGWKTVGFSKPTEKLNSPGRFPANLILDETAAEMLDAQSRNLKGPGNTKRSDQKQITGNIEFTGGKSFSIPGVNNYPGQEGGASRFFYVAKASKSERNRGLEDLEEVTINDGRVTPIDNAFQRGETKRQNSHPTVKPIKLMTYLIKLIIPPGGIVLDPYMGSGTTGLACKEPGIEFVGIEREPEYFSIAKKRTA